MGLASAMLIFVGLAGVGGCRPPDPVRQAIRGNVQVAGSQSPGAVQGTVTFLPTGGMSGPAVSTAVRDGRYAFTVDNGPLPGTYRVILQLAAVESDSKLPDRGNSQVDAAVSAGKADLLSPAMQAPLRADVHRRSGNLEIRIELDEHVAGDLDLSFSAGS